MLIDNDDEDDDDDDEEEDDEEIMEEIARECSPVSACLTEVGTMAGEIYNSVEENRKRQDSNAGAEEDNLQKGEAILTQENEISLVPSNSDAVPQSDETTDPDPPENSITPTQRPTTLRKSRQAEEAGDEPSYEDKMLKAERDAEATNSILSSAALSAALLGLGPKISNRLSDVPQDERLAAPKGVDPIDIPIRRGASAEETMSSGEAYVVGSIDDSSRDPQHPEAMDTGSWSRKCYILICIGLAVLAIIIAISVVFGTKSASSNAMEGPSTGGETRETQFSQLLLVGNSLADPSLLSDESSSESKAMNWIIYEDPLALDPTNASAENELRILQI
ncbi:hypothetical protein MHU86_20997 [Fragilaria crotonensis]|nr:hypothetical protein MHU86_20997 [Fragilaria crotonensis]